jgi:hypothetical protein
MEMQTDSIIVAICFDYLEMFFAATTAIFIGLTYFLAKKISNSLRKPLQEKLFLEVYKLVNILQNTYFYAEIVTDNQIKHPLKEEIKIRFFQLENFPEKKYKLFKDKPIIINNKIFSKYDELLSYANNPFLPESIAQHLSKLIIKDHKSFSIHNNELTEFIFIGEKNQLTLIIADSTYTELIRPNNNAYSRFKEFYQICIDLKNSILEWLNNPDVKLNLK